MKWYCLSRRRELTKILVLGVVADKIRTFGRLLYHERDNVLLRFDLTDGLRLMDKLKDIVHSHDKAVDTIITFFLSDNNLSV